MADCSNAANQKVRHLDRLGGHVAVRDAKHAWMATMSAAVVINAMHKAEVADCHYVVTIIRR